MHVSLGAKIYSHFAQEHKQTTITALSAPMARSYELFKNRREYTA